MNVWNKFKSNHFLRRAVVLAFIIILLYLMRSMMNMILFTFIFTFLIVKAIRLVQRYMPKTPVWLIVVVIYLLIIVGLYFAITKYLPILVTQLGKMVNSLIEFYQHNQGWLMKYIHHYVSDKTLINQTRQWLEVAISTLTSVGTMTVTVFMSMILSFFYTIELDQLENFSRLFLTSKLDWLFKDIYYFGKVFVNSFGVVIEAQFFIALCNTVITTVCLMLMKMPQIVALALMIFLLSLIPVAGVIISLVPLCLVGYSVGGIRDVVYILVMVACIHMLEAYVLNPKFMASRTELPIFYTFVILLVAEHLFGGWGLIVGVPVFTFFIDVLGVDRQQLAKKPKKRLAPKE